MLRPRHRFLRRGSVTVVVGDPFHPVDAVGRMPCNSSARFAPSSSEGAECQTSGGDVPWSHDESSRAQASDIGRGLRSAPGVLKGDSPKPRLETNFLVGLTPSDGASGPTTPSNVNSGEDSIRG